MHRILRVLAAVFLLAVFASPLIAQQPSKPIPEPLPMGAPYVYQPGNPYWYAPAFPYLYPYPPYWYVPAIPYFYSYPPYWYVSAIPYFYPYPFAASAPIYGRYAWDYTGQFSGGFGVYPMSYPHYPYSYQYPTVTGRVWMGYGW